MIQICAGPAVVNKALLVLDHSINWTALLKDTIIPAKTYKNVPTL